MSKSEINRRKRKYSEEEQIEVDRCNKIRQMLRRAWSRDPKRFECLKDNRRKYVGENKKQRFEHQCNICKEWFKQSDVQIDHVTPCGSFLKYEQLGEWAGRLFLGDLQKVCSECHKIKTKAETEERKLK